MTIFALGVSSFLIALSGALVPGPLFTITVAESARRGAMAGPLIIAGHALLELVMIGLLVFGISAYMTAPVFFAVCIIGGVLLVLMGVDMIRGAGKARFLTGPEGEGGKIMAANRNGSAVLAGIVGSLSNPYWTLWWVTIGVGYLVSALRYGIPGFLAFFVGHILADLAWFTMVSYAVSRGRRFVGDRGYRFLLYGCGTFLLVFGVWFISVAGSFDA